MASDLIRYVAEEVAADGEEGSSWQRLNSFIDNYGAASGSPIAQQLIDDDLRRYVVTAVGRLPNFHPGRIIPAAGNGSGLKGNAKSRKQQHSVDDNANMMEHAEPSRQKDEDTDADHVVKLAKDKELSIEELLKRYDSDFRLVADKETIDKVSIGSAHDVTPPMYRLLTFAMRRRGAGVSFTEIGVKSNSNASNTFFLVLRLCEAGLGVKFRARYNDKMVSWFVTKRYAHLCPHLSLTAFTEGEGNDDEANDSGDERETFDTQDDTRLLEEMSSDAVQDLMRTQEDSIVPDGELEESEEKVAMSEEQLEHSSRDESGLTSLHGLLSYPSLSTEEAAALLANSTVVRLRVLKLLMSSKNNATIRKNLIVRIGVKDSDKAQRKSFNAILRQMEIECLIERCLLRRPLLLQQNHMEPCWMATQKGLELYQHLTAANQQRDLRRMRIEFSQELDLHKSKLLMEVPFARQILDMIDSCREGGATIDQLNIRLGGNKDRRRDLDHILGVLQKPSNPHYDDFTVFSALEQAGRTRSQRLWLRRWRPENLAPNAARSADSLDIWIDLPGECSFASVREWQSNLTEAKGKMVVKREAEGTEEGDNSAFILSSADSSARKKVKRQDITLGEHGEPVKKGRPRKDYSERAIKRAEVYKQKKEARQREDEERKGVETLLDESHSRGNLRKNKQLTPLPEVTSVSILARLDAAKGAVRRVNMGPAQQRQNSVTISSESSESAQRQESQMMPIDPLLLPERRSTTMETDPLHDIESSKAELVPRVHVEAKQARQEGRNMTTQLKRDTILQLFQAIHIVEAHYFDQEYKRFVQSIAGSEGNVSQYMMDRKLRSKLFSNLERTDLIKSSKIITLRGRQRTVWYLSDIAESELRQYCQKVSEGKIAAERAPEERRKRESTILESHQIDAPESFFRNLSDGGDVNVDSLEELLKNVKTRTYMVTNPLIRAQYTGRLPGLGARLQYFHRTVLDLVRTKDEPADWIFDLEWWTSDARLEQYLKLALPPTDETLLDASQESSIKRQPVKAVQESIRQSLQLSAEKEGMKRTLIPLLEHLRVLGLAEPATIETSTAERQGLLYRFSRYASPLDIHGNILPQLADTSIDLRKPEEMERYWDSVMHTCTTSSKSIEEDTATEEGTLASLRNALKRASAWYHHYHLLKPQQVFLSKTISLGVNGNVLQQEELLRRISWKSLTPIGIVRRYYERRFPLQKMPASEPVRKSTATMIPSARGPSTPMPSYSSGSKKIKEKKDSAQKQRLEEFDDALHLACNEFRLEGKILQHVVNGLVLVRRDYGRGGETISPKRLRTIFADVMRNHEAGVSNYNAIVNRTTVGRPSLAKHAIDMSTGKEDTADTRSRKAAIGWTKALDESLRDAIVILRCRDRYRNPSHPRKNWSALDQIMPDINAAARHSRFEQLRKAVGEEAYLSQLEAEWERVWEECRGTEDLEDPHPGHPTEFNLMDHIKLLRARIDKSAVAEKVDSETGEPLPWDSCRLVRLYDYDSPPQAAHDPFSNMARSSLGEMSMDEKSRLLRWHPFTLAATAMGVAPIARRNPGQNSQVQAKKGQSRARYIAMALVKMILATAKHRYDEPVATKLRETNVDSAVMSSVLIEMIDNKIIKSEAKEDREVPDRTYSFGEEYGEIKEDNLETLPFWQIAAGLQQFLQQGGQTTIFGTSSDAEAAADLTLLSKGLVDVDVDLRWVEGMRRDKLFNAKKLNDEQLELPVSLRMRQQDAKEVQKLLKHWTGLLDIFPEPEPILQWFTKGAAESTLISQFRQHQEEWVARNEERVQELPSRLLAVLQQAGPDGLNKEELLTVFGSGDEEISQLRTVVQAAEQAHPPLIFFAGYDEAVLVATSYLFHWTVRIGDSKRVFPHRWIDIHGELNQASWREAIQLVMHAVVTRPGITREQLLVQLRPMLDRSEVCRVINVICQQGLLRKVSSFDHTVQGEDAEWAAMGDRDVALMSHG